MWGKRKKTWLSHQTACLGRGEQDDRSLMGQRHDCSSESNRIPLIYCSTCIPSIASLFYCVKLILHSCPPSVLFDHATWLGYQRRQRGLAPLGSEEKACFPVISYWLRLGSWNSFFQPISIGCPKLTILSFDGFL